VTEYCDELVCLCVCLFVCLPVCPRAYLRNYMSDRHQILCARVARSSSGGVVIRCVLPVLRMTRLFAHNKPYAHVDGYRCSEWRHGVVVRRPQRRCCVALVVSRPRRWRTPRGGSRGGVTRVTSHPPWPARQHFTLLLLCVWLKLFRCRFVPLLEPKPGTKKLLF